MQEKINSAFEKMQERAQRRKSKWNLLLIPISIFYIVGFAYGYYQIILFVIDILFISRDDIFYIYYPNTIWTILLILAIGMPSVVLGFIFTNFTIWLIKPIRIIFENESKGYKGTDFKSTQKTLAKVFLITFLVGLPFVYLYGNTYNALSYKNIVYYNPWYSLNETKYDISKDLNEIKLEITKYGTQSAKLSYKLIMKDKNEIEFAAGNEVEFLQKNWDITNKTLGVKRQIDIDNNALNSLLSQPRFKGGMKEKLLYFIKSEESIK